MPGYSNKSLKDKLGLKDGMKVKLINPPVDYFDALEVTGLIQVADNEPADFIHAFYMNREDLAADSAMLEGKLTPKGMIWVSWPKKSSGLQTNIAEQDLRDILLPTGLVDIKVAAVTDVWSGLKFVRRVK